MCTICFALKDHPDFPFVLCSNRDELLNRGKNSDEVTTHSDGIICGIDQKAKGTWMGLHSKNGNYAAVTNIGPQNGSLSRGKLAHDFIKEKNDDDLKVRKSFGGYNLIWGNLFSENLEINCTTNRDPLDKSDSPPIITWKEGVHAVGNELTRDEFVKAPFMEKEVANILKQFPASKGPVTKETVLKLRDKLSEVLEAKQSMDGYWLPFVRKFFVKSEAGRYQLGTIVTALLIIPILLLLKVFGHDFIDALVYSLFISLAVGMYYHLQMNYLFVNVKIPFFMDYGTVSQTIVIKTREKKIYYFFRNVLSKKNSDWTSFEIDVK